MEELKYELLAEVQGRMEADLIKSFLEAHKIPVELFQESVGHTAFPITIDGLGRVQLFVPKEKSKEAHELLDMYQTPTDEDAQ